VRNFRATEREQEKISYDKNDLAGKMIMGGDHHKRELACSQEKENVNETTNEKSPRKDTENSMK